MSKDKSKQHVMVGGPGDSDIKTESNCETVKTERVKVLNTQKSFKTKAQRTGALANVGSKKKG